VEGLAVNLGIKFDELTHKISRLNVWNDGVVSSLNDVAGDTCSDLQIHDQNCTRQRSEGRPNAQSAASGNEDGHATVVQRVHQKNQQDVFFENG
jgi:hypothetical protein